MDSKTAIESGDARALRQLIDDDPETMNALISWGENGRNRTHPLHYVSDMVCAGTLDSPTAIELVDVLLIAGAAIDFQVDGRGDTPLIGAASLGTQEVGLRLLDAGANPRIRGLFGETALHWAAMLGLDQLVRRLVEGRDLEVEDDDQHSTPLGWAIHGLGNAATASRGQHEECVLILAAAGAKVRDNWLASAQVQASPSMVAALRAGTSAV